jgi:hypothetical protein
MSDEDKAAAGESLLDVCCARLLSARPPASCCAFSIVDISCHLYLARLPTNCLQVAVSLVSLSTCTVHTHFASVNGVAQTDPASPPPPCICSRQPRGRPLPRRRGFLHGRQDLRAQRVNLTRRRDHCPTTHCQPTLNVASFDEYEGQNPPWYRLADTCCPFGYNESVYY